MVVSWWQSRKFVERIDLYEKGGGQIRRSKYCIPKPSISVSPPPAYKAGETRDQERSNRTKLEEKNTKRKVKIMAMAISRFLTALVFFLGAATVTVSGFNVTTLAFDEGYSHLFGEGNLVRSSDGRTVRLLLNRYSGAGFISSDLYHHGFFSASIKLPSDYTAGIVVAFYTSNGDIFPKTHDELDFEFLGNIRGERWRIQTNVYGNGSTSRGREERYVLPFDPTKEAHRYSILWTATHIIFYIDKTPIREVVRSDAMGGDYPSKPMSLYATIWDGSTWATSGGKYKVKYKYAPFVAEFSDLVLRGCRIDPIQPVPSTDHCMEADGDLMAADFAVMTPRKRAAMRRFRERYMTYSVCYDALRYSGALPDCSIIASEQERFWASGHIKFPARRRRSRRQSRMPSAADRMSQPIV